jgi:hypothetical protein
MKYSSDLAAAEILERMHQGNFIGQNYEPGDEALRPSKNASRKIQFSSDAGNTPRLIGFDCNVRHAFRALSIAKEIVYQS